MDTGAYSELVWTPDMIERFWDWQSQYPEAYFTFQFGAEIVRSLSRYLSGRERILDYGCGVGFLLPHLCQYGKDVYGADLSYDSVAATNRRLDGTPNFRSAFTIPELRRQKMTFDAVIAVEIVEHLYDEDLDTMLKEIRYHISECGIVIFTTPNDEDLSKNQILCPESGKVFHRWQHVRSWNAHTLSARLEEAGFEVDSIIETNLTTMRALHPIGIAKQLLNRILGGPGKPHLVCVARRR